MTAELPREKPQLRQAIYQARRKQPDKDQLSRRTIERLFGLPEFRQASTVLWYLDCRSELRTRSIVEQLLDARFQRQMGLQQTIAIPYCTEDANGRPCLGLWRLEDFGELVVGKWNILEPSPERWHDPRRTISPDQLNFVVVPGVAFDSECFRLGNGQGYYDRLLAGLPKSCFSAGLAFECQLVPHVPRQPHDQPVNCVLTPARCLFEKV